MFRSLKEKYDLEEFGGGFTVTAWRKYAKPKAAHLPSRSLITVHRVNFQAFSYLITTHGANFQGSLWTLYSRTLKANSQARPDNCSWNKLSGNRIRGNNNKKGTEQQEGWLKLGTGTEVQPSIKNHRFLYFPRPFTP